MADPRPVPPEAAPPRATTPEPWTAERLERALDHHGIVVVGNYAFTHTDDANLAVWPKGFDETTEALAVFYDDYESAADWLMAHGAPLAAPALESGTPEYRAVRNADGMLHMERVEPYVPTEARTTALLDTLAKAYPVLAENASHMDGGYDLALTQLRRDVAALFARLRTAQAPPP